MKNYYKIMELKSTATDAEIKQAFRTLAKSLHPDVNRSNPNAEQMFADLNEAYEVLSDPEKRAEYNNSINNILMRKRTEANPNGFAANPFNNPYASRFDAAQSILAEKAAMAERAARERMQIDLAIKQAYNDGYAKGFGDSKAKADFEIKKLAVEIASLKTKISDYEKELHYAELDYQSIENKLKALSAENKNFDANESLAADLEREHNKAIEKLRFELNVSETHLSRTREKLKESEAAISKKDLKIETLLDENTRLKEALASYEDYVQDKERDENIEYIRLDRQLKLKQIKKDLKNTYYGTLNVMFWAYDDEIATQYEKLIKRHKSKAEAGDKNAAQKLAAIDEAYSALSTVEKRAEYNKTLEITDELVEHERTLELEYNALIEKHENNLEEKEFWAYVDDLMLQAEGGDPEAQNTLGELYYFGEDLAEDLEQAVFWFKESAKHQNANALFNLGNCYYYGDGVDKDLSKGEGFIKQAAKLGHKEAKAFLEK